MLRPDTEPILITAYDPSWPGVFEALRVRAAEALGPLVLAIEHVGSTAVPGLAAKPIVDLDVVVCAADVPAAIRALERLGYRHEGNLGIEGREAFVWPAGTPRHHLYVCPAGSPELARHLAFRDRLRADPEVACAYAKLKRELATAYHHDRGAYTEAKSAFIQSVLKSPAHRGPKSGGGP